MEADTTTSISSMPRVIFGTSSLGNLFVCLSNEIKLEIVSECFKHSKGPVVFDTAGKYGAGLALESLGKCLKQLNILPEKVIISNKLGWIRTELKTPEPLFEPGVWRNLKYDAVQKISYDGILECFYQGNKLLDGYIPSMVSVHDPDEYMARAVSPEDSQKHYADILDAYRALEKLKKEKKVASIGVGAKTWNIIERISGDVKLDWVMIANSMTIKNHPAPLLQLMKKLESQGIKIINSAIFHSGFLTGGSYFDYKLILPDTVLNKTIYSWRDYFFKICRNHGVKPAEACVQFALLAPGVKSIALSTTNPERVKENLNLADKKIDKEFWKDLIREGLVDREFFESEAL